VEDLNDKVLGGNLAADEWNQVPSELQNVITQTGQTLSAADLNQVGKGLADYAGNSNFYTDSGIANAYVLTTVGSIQSITAYTDGLAVEFIAGNTNAGASTVNVATLGVKSIVNSLGALVGGEIVATERIKLKFRSGADNFIIDANVPANSVLTGSITAWPVPAIPSDYLECDGAEISRTTFSDLFAVIGTNYGVGDGSTTFDIPDLRGEFIRGFDNTAGNDPDAGSRTDRGDGTTGDAVGTKQAEDFLEHIHEIKVNDVDVGGTAHAQGEQSGPSGLFDSNAAGGNETRPRNVYMMYIIKT